MRLTNSRTLVDVIYLRIPCPLWRAQVVPIVLSPRAERRDRDVGGGKNEGVFRRKRETRQILGEQPGTTRSVKPPTSAQSDAKSGER